MYRKKIAIIGGGIIGCLTAIKLKESGFEVVVIDKHEIGKESSWAGAGILFPLMPWNYEPKVYELCKLASRFYENFSIKLYDSTGIDPEYKKPLESWENERWENLELVRWKGQRSFQQQRQGQQGQGVGGRITPPHPRPSLVDNDNNINTMAPT